MINFPFRRKVLNVLVLGVMVASVAFSGCSPKGAKKPAPQKEEPPVKVGVAMATMEGDGYAALKKAMEKMKKTEKVDLMWMDAKNDPVTQGTQVEELVKKKAKVIILHMVNPGEGRQLVSKLQEKQIRVLAIERLPKNVALDGYVTPDYLRAGEVQGQFVAGKVVKGTVLVFTGAEDTLTNQALYAGFRQGLGTGHALVIKKITVSDTIDPKVIEEEVLQALKANPNAAAIVAQSGSQTAAVIKYLQENKDKADLITTVGLGADKHASVALATGQHDAEVDTRPDLIAYYALKGAKLLAQGQHIDYDQRVKNDESDVPVKVIPVRLIRMDNTYLLEERWGDLKKEAKKAEEKEKKKAEKQESKPKVKVTEGGGKDKEQQKKTKLMIKTKEGKTIEIEVDGEIQEIKSQTGGAAKGKEAKGGKQEGGSGQGGSEGE